MLSAQPKKVLLQGVGGVGSKVAELLTKEHGVDVVAYDMFDRSDAVDSPHFSFVKTFEELLTLATRLPLLSPKPARSSVPRRATPR